MGLLDSLSDMVISSLDKSIPNVGTKDIVQSVMTTSWDISDDFEVYISNNYLIEKNINILDEENMKKSVISVQLPTMSAQEDEAVIGGLRRVMLRQSELFRFVIRFRDYEGGLLRKYFTAMWAAQQYKFPDEVSSAITITMQGSLMFYSGDCLITQISEQSYDNTNTGISEFDVTFVTPSFTDEFIVNFGKDMDYASAFRTTQDEAEEQSSNLIDDITNFFNLN
jgi:hypothetical protein